mmetsp:Transcript_624/g.982  ORF Transcript_624/g.982 Transcript_624/m.982 type:complete len:459 (-) Transcript_624:249-1625(-)
MDRKAKYLGTVILIATSIFVVTEDRRNTTRFLTPFTGPNEKYSYTSADTQYGQDPTRNMDKHLENCWNFGTAAQLHDTSEKRSTDYTKYFKKYHLYPVLQYAALPKLFAMTGDNIGLILGDSKTVDLRTGKGSPGFHSMSLWNYSFTFRCAICEEPPPTVSGKKTQLKGDFITFAAWYWGRYGHATHDSLPWFAYLKEMADHNNNNSNLKYILLDVRNAKDIIQTTDPEFAANRVVWAETDELFEIEGSVTTLDMPRTRENNPRMMDYLRLWMQKGQNRTYTGDGKIIYYDRRNHKDTIAGRHVRQDIEDELLIRIHQAMKKHGRKEELVIFNGLRNRTGDSLTAKDQFQIFKDATTIIGPHGSGMSGNLLWTNPNPESCDKRVKVLEFIGDKNTAKETSPNRREPYISHWPWMRGWPFEWHHMLYEQTSKRKSLVINLEEFSETLDAMWGDKTSGQI